MFEKLKLKVRTVRLVMIEVGKLGTLHRTAGRDTRFRVWALLLV